MDVNVLDQVFNKIAISIGGSTKNGRKFHVPIEDIQQIIWTMYLEGKFDGYKGESDDLKHFSGYVRKVVRNHLIQSAEGRNYNFCITAPYMRNKKKKEDSKPSLYWDEANPNRGTLSGSTISVVDIEYENVSVEDDFNLSELDEVRKFLLTKIDDAPLLNALLVLGFTPMDFFFDELYKEFINKSTGRYPRESYHYQIPILLTKIMKEEVDKIDPDNVNFPIFAEKNLESSLKMMISNEKVFIRDDVVVPISNKLHKVKDALTRKGIESRKVMRWISWAYEFPDEINNQILSIRQKKM